MKSQKSRTFPNHWAVAVLGCTVALAGAGCTLDDVDVPPLAGPSELGLSLQMQASPDVVNADGVSQSVVTITARDNNGRAAANRLIYISGQGDGALIAGGVLVGPVQSGFTVATGSNGIAQVVYQAGFGIRTVYIQARPYGFDAFAGLTREVAIDQR
jgi:hypothetical protein